VITLPKLPWQELALDPEGAVTRAVEHDDRSLEELIAVGGPVSVPVTAGDLTEDEEAAVFVRARESSFSFHLVHLACAFRPTDDEPFLTATVRMQLSRGDGASSPLPIALSIKPLRLGEPVEISRSVRLGASLKIFDAGAEKAETRTFDDLFLEGLNELRPDPSWELRRTRHTQIRGSQRFVLVVQSPKGCRGRGVVEVSATVKRKRFGPLSYVASLSGGRPLEFVLEG
jgi:hypothetical protein